MGTVQIPVERAHGSQHGQVILSGDSRDRLPLDSVYVNPESGQIFSGNQGHTYGDLKGGEVEMPVSTWYAPWL